MSSPPSSACPSPITPTMPKTPGTPNFQNTYVHPFANTKKRLEIIRNPGIDIEEEARLIRETGLHILSYREHEHLACGWTNVGDKDKLGGGAYVVYDCVVKTKEGTTIHAHKRYNAFVQLDAALRRSLPRHQQRYVPQLPPKAPFARYRPAFLDQRRRQLEYWLSAVLLHPDVGASKALEGRRFDPWRHTPADFWKLMEFLEDTQLTHRYIIRF
ncbi:Phox-like protein [Lentinula edodes]|uniref:Endosomal/vacuolar adapter protein YPT35 n=1 Tax=Lentinula edodes TaxID=5353 RepID=A0A1Q3EL73_LENED|nr:Phox-like protein [Lentinula edodes]